jgi:hypothetical protein
LSLFGRICKCAADVERLARAAIRSSAHVETPIFRRCAKTAETVTNPNYPADHRAEQAMPGEA